MKRKNLLLGAAAAAVLAAFNPALADEGSTLDVWSGVSASQGSTGIGSSATMEQSASAEQSSATAGSLGDRLDGTSVNVSPNVGEQSSTLPSNADLIASAEAAGESVEGSASLEHEERGS